MTDEKRANQCYVTSIDGQPVRIQGNPQTPEDHAAIEEIFRAAQRYAASLPPGPLERECPVCGVQPGAFCRNEKDRIRAIHSSRRGLGVSGG